MTGKVGIDLLICRIRYISVRIARLSSGYTLELTHIMFRTPETSTRKIYILHLNGPPEID